MNRPVEITNQEWSDLTKEVAENGNQINYLKNRTDGHKKRIDTLEDAHIALPLEIQNAISNSLEPLSSMFKEMFKELSDENKALRAKVDDLEKEKYKKTASTLEWVVRGAGAVVIGYVVTEIIKAVVNH